MKTKWYVQLLKYFILGVVTLVIAYPIFLMISSSFKSKLEIFKSPLGLPEKLSFENYKIVWEKVNFSDYIVIVLLCHR